MSQSLRTSERGWRLLRQGHACLYPTLMMLMLFVVAGCQKQGEEYFFLAKDGTQANYTIQYIAPLAGLQKAQMSVRSEGVSQINGKPYHKTVVAYSGLPGATPEVTYCRRASDGIYCISDLHRDLPEYLDNPLPVTVGMTWTTKGPDSTSENRADSIETLELFNKKYEKCLRVISAVTGKGQQYTLTSYYAPGVGLVKFTFILSGITFDGQLDSPSNS